MTQGLSALPIRLGISSCLLGEQVRFDGGHKRDTFINEALGKFFEFIPVCPEVAIGLGIPRPPIRLIGDPESPRAVGVRDPDLDFSTALRNYGQRMGRELDDLSGYIFKKGSPSCGMERVKVYQTGQPSKAGTGLYARAFMDQQPLLPVEEEGRLGDPVLRENFIERVFAYRRWQELEARGLSAARLVDFHTIHKLNLMAHGTEHYRAWVKSSHRPAPRDCGSAAQLYIDGFMAALKHRATRKRHTNVLMHIMGYLKKNLDSDDKAELLEVIEAYRLGLVPLIVPITLLKHHFRRHPDAYMARQIYLNPHPPELMLRNSI